jgi:hypothetical protein
MYYVALYWRCDGYINSFWYYPLTGFAVLAGYIFCGFPAPRWACIFDGFLLVLH